MFLDQDQMYLRMCNVNKEKILWKIYTVFNGSTNILIYIFLHLFSFSKTPAQFFN